MIATDGRWDWQARWRGRGTSLFGIALVVIGALLLLDRTGTIRLEDDWWTYIPIGYGVARMVIWDSARGVAAGLNWVLLGLWLQATTSHWYGLDWPDSWPLALVAIGLSTVVRALLEPMFDRRSRSHPTAGGPQS